MEEISRSADHDQLRDDSVGSDLYGSMGVQGLESSTAAGVRPTKFFLSGTIDQLYTGPTVLQRPPLRQLPLARQNAAVSSRTGPDGADAATARTGVDQEHR